MKCNAEFVQVNINSYIRYDLIDCVRIESDIMIIAWIGDEDFTITDPALITSFKRRFICES